MRNATGLLLATTVSAAVLVGCASHTTGAAQPLERARVAAAATLDPDGSVPWVDEPATDADFLPARTPPPAATGPTCRAADLTADMRPWTHKSTNGEAFNPILDASLYGWVNLTNHGTAPCTLSGWPSVGLLSHGAPIPVEHATIGSKPAKVGLPVGGSASFRMDWDAPFCQVAARPDQLRIDLPGKAGVMTLALVDSTTPGCVRQESHPELNSSALTISPIAAGAVEPAAPALPSPLTRLSVRIQHQPATVTEGQTVTFQVVIANPTASDISIAGRPGYRIEALCVGTQGRAGVGADGTYLLNNRAVTSIPAHGSVTFDMRITMPAGKPMPGPTLVITWRMTDRTMLGDGQPYAVISIPTTTT